MGFKKVLLFYVGEYSCIASKVVIMDRLPEECGIKEGAIGAYGCPGFLLEVVRHWRILCENGYYRNPHVYSTHQSSAER